ncbi:MAG TPA: SRPBCC domain-containing protein [Solirubrobacteraceae bacterium]
MLDRYEEGLRIVRMVRAPLADVWDAWVSPGRLVSWWGPPGVTVVGVAGELRVGGRYVIAMLRDGEEVELEWRFVEIRLLQRLVFEWRFTRGENEPRERSLVTIAFRGSSRGTEVTVTHDGIVSPGARDSHADGWLRCLDGLETILTHIG